MVKRLPLDRLYLWLCTPILLAMTYILPPFQAPDEVSHFFRAIQMSHAELTPLPATDYHRPAAGGRVEREAVAMKKRLCPTWMWYCAAPGRPAIADILSTEGRPDADVRDVTAFSNTVIYLPLAHAAPAAAIATARAAGLRSLGWLYAGRIANALAALCATGLALRLLRGRRSALLVFAVATLPMTLSVVPSLGADSAVISCSVLLAALCIRLHEGDWHPWLWPVLLIAIFYAAAAKLAYLPLVAIPPACALAGRSPRRLLTGTVLVALVAVALTLAWSSTMHSHAFPISPDPFVDIPGQLRFLMSHPVQGARNLLVSMALEPPRAAVQLVGWKLSAFTVPLPLGLVALPLAILAIAIVSSGMPQPTWALRPFVLVVLFGCVSATFLFLYIQDTAVAAPRVHGFQGRYLLPVIPFLALVVPLWRLAGSRSDTVLRTAAVGGAVFNAVAVTIFLALRTWQ